MREAEEFAEKNTEVIRLGIQYMIVSDYAVLIIFLVKIYKGLRFLHSYVKKPKDDDLLLDPLAKEKFTCILLTNQRRKLNEYMRFTVIFLYFVLIEQFA